MSSKRNKTLERKKQERRTLRGSLGSPHTAGQMGTKSKWDESQNAANGDENGK